MTNSRHVVPVCKIEFYRIEQSHSRSLQTFIRLTMSINDLFHTRSSYHNSFVGTDPKNKTDVHVPSVAPKSYDTKPSASYETKEPSTKPKESVATPTAKPGMLTNDRN